jgi:hypothetical protein
MNTPVVLLIFKRPETTAKVFEVIQRAKPKQLFVIADGPRLDHPGEAEKCIEARTVIEQVNWDCEVIKRYSDINLGSGPCVSSGLDWVFSQVEQAIVLEDDCVPDLTFFPFCEELLEKYRNTPEILHISGSNYQFGRSRTNYSYYFSRHPHIWGWASWRRAWNNYDFQMSQWASYRSTDWLKQLHQSQKISRFWSRSFDDVIGRKDIWDFQWTFACWLNNGLSIIPDVNLVSNFGFDSEATHTVDPGNPYSRMRTREMSFPLNHPPGITWNREADLFTHRTLFEPSLITRSQRKVRKLLRRIEA